MSCHIINLCTIEFATPAWIFGQVNNIYYIFGGDRIVLTNRDIEFLNDIYKVKILNTKRIAKLFGSYNYTTKRLKQLVNGGYIKVCGYLPNREHVYTITNKGCRIIGKTNLSAKRDVSPHTLACADVYFYLKKELSYFETEVDFDKKFRSDILIKLDRYILVEVDLSNRRFKEKVKRWEQFYSSSSYKKYFDIFPPILITSTNVEKIQMSINSISSIDLNYSYKNYKEIENWRYSY